MERSDPHYLIGRDSQVMLVPFEGGSQPNVTPSLTADFVAEAAKKQRQLEAIHIAAASSRDDLVLNLVKADDTGARRFVRVAADRVLHHRF